MLGFRLLGLWGGVVGDGVMRVRVGGALAVGGVVGDWVLMTAQEVAVVPSALSTALGSMQLAALLNQQRSVHTQQTTPYQLHELV